MGDTRWTGRLLRAVSTSTLTPTKKEKCKKPVIQYENGKLIFSSETEGAQYVYSISDDDMRTATTNDVVALSLTYVISVYAIKAGYDNSDVVTAALCWIDAAPQTEGIENGIGNVSANAILIQSSNGTLNISGAREGNVINIYTITGVMVESAQAKGTSISIETGLRKGETAIVKIDDKSMKVTMK